MPARQDGFKNNGIHGGITLDDLHHVNIRYTDSKIPTNAIEMAKNDTSHGMSIFATASGGSDDIKCLWLCKAPMIITDPVSTSVTPSPSDSQ